MELGKKIVFGYLHFFDFRIFCGDLHIQWRYHSRRNRWNLVQGVCGTICGYVCPDCVIDTMEKRENFIRTDSDNRDTEHSPWRFCGDLQILWRWKNRARNSRKTNISSTIFFSRLSMMFKYTNLAAISETRSHDVLPSFQSASTNLHFVEISLASERMGIRADLLTASSHFLFQWSPRIDWTAWCIIFRPQSFSDARNRSGSCGDLHKVWRLRKMWVLACREPFYARECWFCFPWWTAIDKFNHARRKYFLKFGKQFVEISTYLHITVGRRNRCPRQSCALVKVNLTCSLVWNHFWMLRTKRDAWGK